eukprot:scaffold3920_cov262-Pinguiococcus_pyrenoidosus.AAC.5
MTHLVELSGGQETIVEEEALICLQLEQIRVHVCGRRRVSGSALVSALGPVNSLRLAPSRKLDGLAFSSSDASGKRICSPLSGTLSKYRLSKTSQFSVQDEPPAKAPGTPGQTQMRRAVQFPRTTATARPRHGMDRGRSWEIVGDPGGSWGMLLSYRF